MKCWSLCLHDCVHDWKLLVLVVDDNFNQIQKTATKSKTAWLWSSEMEITLYNVSKDPLNDDYKFKLTLIFHFILKDMALLIYE